MNFGKMFGFGGEKEKGRRNDGFDKQAVPPQISENHISEEEAAMLAGITRNRVKLEYLISDIEQAGENHPEYPQLEVLRKKLREMIN